MLYFMLGGSIVFGLWEMIQFLISQNSKKNIHALLMTLHVANIITATYYLCK